MTLQAAAMLARQKDDQKREDEETQAKFENGEYDEKRTASQVFRRISMSLMSPGRRKSVEASMKRGSLTSMASSASPPLGSDEPSPEEPIQLIVGGSEAAEAAAKRKSMSVLDLDLNAMNAARRKSVVTSGSKPSPRASGVRSAIGGEDPGLIDPSLTTMSLTTTSLTTAGRRLITSAGEEPDPKSLREQPKLVLGATSRRSISAKNQNVGPRGLSQQQQQQQQVHQPHVQLPQAQDPRRAGGFVGLSGQKLAIDPEKLMAAGFKSRRSVAANANAQLAGEAANNAGSWSKKMGSMNSASAEANRKFVRFGDDGSEDAQAANKKVVQGEGSPQIG